MLRAMIPPKLSFDARPAGRFRSIMSAPICWLPINIDFTAKRLYHFTESKGGKWIYL